MQEIKRAYQEFGVQVVREGRANKSYYQELWKPWKVLRAVTYQAEGEA